MQVDIRRLSLDDYDSLVEVMKNLIPKCATTCGIKEIYRN